MTLRHVDLVTLSTDERERSEYWIVGVHFVWQESVPNSRPNPLLHRLSFVLRLSAKEIVLGFGNARLDELHTICKQLSAMSSM